MARSTLQFDADFDTLDAPIKNALVNPQETSSASEAVIQSAALGEMPRISAPGNNGVILAQGIIRDGVAIRDAEVRELTGDDEEALAKTGSNWLRFFDTIVSRGTVSVGGEEMSKAIADELLIGDREDLILAIRRITFGDTLDIEDHECPTCGRRSDLTINLDSVPHVGKKEPDRLTYEVKLKNKRVAQVRFPTGADQHAIYTNEDATVAEQNTLLLARCVLSIDGEPLGNSYQSAATVKGLGMADRRTLLKYLAEQQPGPRFSDIEYTHDACGTVIKLPLGLAEMFLGV